MFIADRYLNIKEDENHMIEDGMIERLDEMLDEYKVPHFFSLPLESENGIAKDSSHCLSIAYESENEMTFDLVYALWSKVYRHTEDGQIAKAMRKIATEHHAE